MVVQIGEREVHGVGLDGQSRCEHYRSDSDVVAIRFACCGAFYACIRCHEEMAEHLVLRWKSDQFREEGILCGACGSTLSIGEYLECGEECPFCGHGLTPVADRIDTTTLRFKEERPPIREAAFLNNDSVNYSDPVLANR